MTGAVRQTVVARAETAEPANSLATGWTPPPVAADGAPPGGTCHLLFKAKQGH
jgi:hypothetical protein